MDLRAYESTKFKIAAILREIAPRVPEKRADLKARLTDLFTRLAEDRFNLVVAGRFSRGKSTLMNAILGVDRLPTGILPLTSVVTSVAYASREEVQIEFAGHHLDLEIPISALADYITERGNPGNLKRIVKARIGLPAELLRRGFCFVDTPGLGSAITENARTTEAFLPEADALLMVSGYDAPLSDDEVRIARTLARFNRRLFFVLNKQDLVTDEERQEVFAYVQGRLAEIFDGKAPRIFSVSARSALEGKLAGDQSRLDATGMPALEQELTRFLIEDKNDDFLRGMCDRVAQLLSNLESDIGAQNVTERLAALLGDGRPEPLTSAANTVTTIEPLVMPKIENCPICKQLEDVKFEFLCHFQYDLTNSDEARQSFAATGGLCAAHLRQYASMASEYGICMALVPLLERLTATLRNAATRANSVNVSVPETLQTTEAECVVCQICTATELKAIQNIAARRAQSQLAAKGQMSSLCMPHLRMLASRIGNCSFLTTLLQNEAAATERLTEDMQRYALKRDGIRRGLTTEDESRAAMAAIALIVGPN